VPPPLPPPIPASDLSPPSDSPAENASVEVPVSDGNTGIPAEETPLQFPFVFHPFTPDPAVTHDKELTSFNLVLHTGLRVLICRNILVATPAPNWRLWMLDSRLFQGAWTVLLRVHTSHCRRSQHTRYLISKFLAVTLAHPLTNLLLVITRPRKKKRLQDILTSITMEIPPTKLNHARSRHYGGVLDDVSSQFTSLKRFLMEDRLFGR